MPKKPIAKSLSKDDGKGTGLFLAAIILPLIAVAVFMSVSVGSKDTPGLFDTFFGKHPMMLPPYIISVVMSVAVVWGLLLLLHVGLSAIRKRRFNMGELAMGLMVGGSGLAGIALAMLVYGALAFINHFLPMPIGLYCLLYIGIVVIGLPLAGPTLFSLVSKPGSYFHTAAKGVRDPSAAIEADATTRKLLRSEAVMKRRKSQPRQSK